MKPAITDFDGRIGTTVIVVPLTVLVSAALDHSGPRVVCDGAFANTIMPMHKAARMVSGNTATASGEVFSKTNSTNDFEIATVTKTEPIRFVFMQASGPFGNKSSESFFSKIEEFAHAT